MTPSLQHGKKLALLYVEDEADAREMVSRMLALNYPQLALYTAENGAAGLEQFREHAPDIVMTDINMPVMDGLRMSREIKEARPDTVIVAVTAHSDTSYLLNAIEIGIHHYVMKPINYEELFGVTDRIVEQLLLRQVVEEQNQSLIQSQHLLAAAQRIAHLGSWQWQLEGDQVSWSEEMFRICGLEPGLPPGYEEFLERVHPEDREQLRESTRQTIETGVPQGPVLFRVQRDGEYRVLRGEAEPVSNDQGRVVTLIGTAHDVTELKKAEERIRALSNELEQRVIQRTSVLQATVQELESFSYVVSHDLRAPVARLEGFCRALVEDCTDCSNPNCSSYAERADRVVKQIKQIIDAFNQLSRYASCRLGIANVDLAGLSRSIVAKLRQRDPRRRALFSIPDRIPVKGDARLLHIVMEELLQNAWKFTAKRDEAHIEVGGVMVRGGPVYFVRDNGAGFNMKYADKLFKPFQTVHSPDEFGWSGTAIGLAAVHSIVLRHGGRVWAEGVVDQGATFYFTLEENPEPESFGQP